MLTNPRMALVGLVLLALGNASLYAWATWLWSGAWFGLGLPVAVLGCGLMIGAGR